MARNVSLAEHYRAHAEAFRLALELGVTPKEAEAVLAQRAARSRWEESSRQLQAAMQEAAKIACANIDAMSAAMAQAAEQRQPWMMRD